MTTTTPIESHDVHSDRLMRHAQEMLEQDDRLQASEKAWGAVAHKLKEIVRERGQRDLRYRAHADAWDVVDRIATGSPNADAIRATFALAERLHINFYDDTRRRPRLDRDLRQIRGLLDTLDQEQQRWRAAGRPLTPPLEANPPPRRRRSNGPGTRQSPGPST